MATTDAGDLVIREVDLRELPDQLNDAMYTTEKYPLLLDATGTAYNYLKYRARCLS